MFELNILIAEIDKVQPKDFNVPNVKNPPHCFRRGTQFLSLTKDFKREG